MTIWIAARCCWVSAYSNYIMARVVHVSTLPVVVAVVGLLLSSCGGSGAVPEPVSAQTLDPPPSETTPRPAPTLADSPVATAAPIPVQTPTAEAGSPGPVEDPVREPVDAREMAGLWAGDLIPDPGQTGYAPPWLALRVRPGDDPDEDSWRLETGPWPISTLPPVSTCTPQRQADGWKLSSCTGIVQGDLTAFMPDEPEEGFEVTLQGAGFTTSASLTRVASRDEPSSTDNVTVLWRQPGEGIHTDIWAEDGLVFAPRSDGVIEIMDVEDGTIIGRAEAWGAVLDVKARDGLLYAATALIGLMVFDISDPAAPELVGHFEKPAAGGAWAGYTSFHNIFLSPGGRLVYAIDQSAHPNTQLLVIDVSDPAAPAEAGRFHISAETSGFDFKMPHDVNVVEVDGRLTAFLNYLSAGLWILDVTDPAAVSTVGSIAWDGIFSHSGWPFSLDGRLYYAHNSEGYDRHMTVLDVTNPASPAVVSRFKTRDGVSIHNVQVIDGIAYVSYYIDGLRVVDLRDPERPKEVAHFDTVPDANERALTQGAWGVRVLDGVVYLSDIESGIHAFEVDVE